MELIQALGLEGPVEEGGHAARQLGAADELVRAEPAQLVVFQPGPGVLRGPSQQMKRCPSGAVSRPETSALEPGSSSSAVCSPPTSKRSVTCRGGRNRRAAKRQIAAASSAAGMMNFVLLCMSPSPKLKIENR